MMAETRGIVVLTAILLAALVSPAAWAQATNSEICDTRATVQEARQCEQQLQQQKRSLQSVTADLSLPFTTIAACANATTAQTMRDCMALWPDAHAETCNAAYTPTVRATCLARLPALGGR